MGVVGAANGFCWLEKGRAATSSPFAPSGSTLPPPHHATAGAASLLRVRGFKNIAHVDLSLGNLRARLDVWSLTPSLT